jgi:hypothetical protein
MRKLTLLEEAKIKILWETGCIDQKQLAKVFGCGQQNVSRVINQGKKK